LISKLCSGVELTYQAEILAVKLKYFFRVFSGRLFAMCEALVHCMMVAKKK
jgi:hypothetical protein